MDELRFAEIWKAGAKRRPSNRKVFYDDDEFVVLWSVVEAAANAAVKYFAVICKTASFRELNVSCECTWTELAPRMTDRYCARIVPNGFVLEFYSSAVSSVWELESINGGCVGLSKNGLPSGSVEVLVKWRIRRGDEEHEGSFKVQVF